MAFVRFRSGRRLQHAEHAGESMEPESAKTSRRRLACVGELPGESHHPLVVHPTVQYRDLHTGRSLYHQWSELQSMFCAWKYGPAAQTRSRESKGRTILRRHREDRFGWHEQL